MENIKAEVLLYGTKNGIEDLLSAKPENILSIIPLAKRDGYTNFRIVDYTHAPLERPDFIGALNINHRSQT
jgi:hypothetical protein